MEMHYCTIFGDCCHCPAPYCPYEKLDDDRRREDEDEEDEEDYG